MSPTMRPSAIRKLMPSSAMVLPKALRRPRASMHAMGSTVLLLFSLRRRSASPARIQQFFRFQAKPLNGCVDPGPLFAKKLLTFALQQQTACAGIDEHAKASSGLDKPFVHQLLITLQNREWIDPKFGRDIAHRGQRIAFLENSFEYHRDDTVPKLAINRLTVIPLMVHQFQIVLTATLRSFCPFQVQMRVDHLVPREHEGPVFGVMVGVYHGEYGVVHVAVLHATGDVD